ncbi:hypothetical protein D3C80_1650140 [compost metagenome]
MMSMFCSMPNLMCRMSFSVTPGRLVLMPGTLTPLRCFSMPPFVMRQVISVPSAFTTSRRTRPSSIRMMLPGFTSCGSCL